MTAKEFGQRVDDDICAMFQRAKQIGAGHCIIDNQWQAVFAGNGCNGCDIHKCAARIGQALNIDCLGFLIDLAFKALWRIGISPAHFPAEILK
jgi:hypothetical protein